MLFLLASGSSVSPNDITLLVCVSDRRDLCEVAWTPSGQGVSLRLRLLRAPALGPGLGQKEKEQSRQGFGSTPKSWDGVFPPRAPSGPRGCQDFGGLPGTTHRRDAGDEVGE